MAKPVRYGLSFLKSMCRGCRRHLVIWLVILLSLYSIFYVSQYIVVDTEHVNILKRNEEKGQGLRTSDVVQVHAPKINSLPTWGNVSGLKQHIKPVLIEYSRARKLKGSRVEFTLPWDEPEMDYQIKACRDLPIVNIASKATLIITLHGARIDKALISLFSILRFTDINLVEDVIIIGDIGLPGVYRDIYDLFPDYLPTFRLFISPKRTTVTQARKYAAKFAHGEMLVFLDGLVIVTNHWLDNIIAAILKNPNSVIQPIIVKNDTVLDDFGQPIFIHKKELQLDLTLKDIKTPVFPNRIMNGFEKQPIVSSSAFAMKKTLYENLRELEDYSGYSDVEMIVISLKAWMCGGGDDGVLLAPCSCVRLQAPITSTNQNSSNISPSVSKTLALKRKRHLLFLASTWFTPYDDVYKCMLPKSRQMRLPYTDKRTIKHYKIFYNRLNCKKFPEFVKQVQPNLIKPKPNTTHYGTLVLQGRDLFMTRSGDGSNLTFVPNLAPRAYPFIYANYSLTLRDMCVTYVPNASVRLKYCQNKNVNQRWLYTNGQFQLKINTHLCIVKQKTSDFPIVNLCKNVNVISKFNFTYSFDANCIK